MIQTIIVIILVAVAVFFAVKRIYKMLSKKQSGDCASCCSSDSCELSRDKTCKL